MGENSGGLWKSQPKKTLRPESTAASKQVEAASRRQALPLRFRTRATRAAFRLQRKDSTRIAISTRRAGRISQPVELEPVFHYDTAAFLRIVPVCGKASPIT